jgi:hypothetical protein
MVAAIVQVISIGFLLWLVFCLGQAVERDERGRDQ